MLPAELLVLVNDVSSTLWYEYIQPDNTWCVPFLLPLLGWISAYTYCVYDRNHQQQQPPFHKWYFIHNVHNMGAIVLGTISIYSGGGYDTSSGGATTTAPSTPNMMVFNERIPILWSLSYFLVDIMDCSIRQDVPYLFHAVCCFVLGAMNYTVPTLRLLRMNSKASYCELSNPFMHWAKRTRNPYHFLLFAIVFTCCRIIWLPIMYYQLISYRGDTMLPWYHPSCCVLVAFYGLNVYWYSKILHILFTGASTTDRNNTIVTSASSSDKSPSIKKMN
jgi:TLC domain